MRIGTKLAHYEITSHLGSGGFGDVYQATDSKLGRSVAIKFLPAEFARDVERLSRFRREAQVLASLNHPNIAHVYGLEEAGETRCIVMELVTGETLQERIERGPIPVDESLPIAKQIAEALEAAHEKGVIHRDLKPGNVMLTSDGKVKVLDFGLAKAYETDPSPAASNSPTLASVAATNAGVILGTAAYMAPEQARGKSVDKRADIWAFGALLFEMLTGRQTFPNGETVSDTLAAILKGEPDWRALPADTPPRIRGLLERCLRKDLRRRLPDIAAARIEIEEALSEPEYGIPSAPTVTSRRNYIWPALMIILLLTTTSLAIWMLLASSPDRRIVQFDVVAPDGTTISAEGPPLSPDGSKIAFIAGPLGMRRIWVRPLDSSVAQPLPGTEGVVRFVWSPDSQHIAFYSQGKLKRIPVAGGPAMVIADEGGRDISWSGENVILFGGQGKALLKVSAAPGSQPVPATKLAEQETTHDYPDFLPDNHHFLYLVRHGIRQEDWDLYVGDLDSPQRLLLSGIHSGARYSPTGHVVFLRDKTLMAQPFDVRRLELTGEAFPIAEGVSGGVTTPFSVSMNGSLAYVREVSGGESQPTWFDRTGKQLELAGSAGEYRNLELSPDGKYVAFDRGTPPDIFVLDILRGLTSTVTTSEAADAAPVWSHDSRTIAFLSGREPAGTNRPQNTRAGGNLYTRSLGVVGEDKQLWKSAGGKTPTHWSRDGRYLVYISGEDVWALSLVGEVKPLRITETPFAEGNARISPNGDWIAYDSLESGMQSEVHIQSFPQPGRKVQVSTKGGYLPRWSVDGKELFYLALYPDPSLMAVTITSTGSESAPVPLFPTRLPNETGLSGLPGSRSYDVSRKGFLMNVITTESAAVPVTVIHNWAAGLKK